MIATFHYIQRQLSGYNLLSYPSILFYIYLCYNKIVEIGKDAYNWRTVEHVPTIVSEQSNSVLRYKVCFISIC